MFEIKFAYITGFKLVFTAYQPNGSGRGIPQQLLPELAEGYYAGSPIAVLVAGDEVIVYTLETVTWEGEDVDILTYDSVYWEGDRIFYGDEWVFDLDTEITELVTTVGAVVGGNEYSISALDFSLILEDIGTLIIGQQSQSVSYDETGFTATGQPRQLSSSTVGYVETVMREI